jgi:uncharacterized protein (TIGR02145 family)
MRNADGSVMANSAVSLTLMIHDGNPTGTMVYQESHALTSNTQGLVSCVVGNGVVSAGNFETINWGSGDKFLHVMMGSTDLGTQQLLSVPYALHAGEVPSRVSETGDTLWVGDTFVIIPGISSANYPPILGCTDAQACNFNVVATQNDNSCLYQNATCDDNNANTINDVINANCQCVGTLSNTGATLLPGNSACTNEVISVTGCGGQSTLTYDGITYDLVQIGGQCWFADNLATDQYRNGDLITTGLTNTNWSNTSAGAYHIYANSPANDATYGKLYNWLATTDARGLCPTGWHIPSDCEWMYLENSLGMTVSDQILTDTWIRGTDQAGRLKTTNLWDAPNLGANNNTGFAAVPGGYRASNGSGGFLNSLGYWWTSTAPNSTNAWYRVMGANYATMNRINGSKKAGFSVRCVRD